MEGIYLLQRGSIPKKDNQFGLSNRHRDRGVEKPVGEWNAKRRGERGSK